MSSQYALVNSHNGAENRLLRAKRQAILMQVIEGNRSKKKLTYEKMAEQMREHPWVAARWPSYSPATALADFNEVMSLVADDLKALAMPYLAENLNNSDKAIVTLIGFSQDSKLPEKLRIDALLAMLRFMDYNSKIFGHYAAQEKHVQKVTATIDLDAFQKLRRQAQGELEFIDGEFEEKQEDVDDG